MKKQVKIISLLIMLSLLTSCGDKAYKKADGINMLWADQIGYFSRAASCFEEDNVRYIIYETNKKKNDETVSFALKKATKDGDTWSYESNRTIILESNADGWDKYINSPSIIKGNYQKNDITYHYLLAYSGRSQLTDKINQIGFAYAETMAGPWIKNDNPIITYNADVSGEEYGAGAPSLVSYNQAGQFRLFYSYAETNLANERIVDCDFSDLNNIIIDRGTRQISINGLRDNSDNPILSNADFALDEANNLYVTRDVYPLSGNIPGNATSIQTASADAKILNNFVDYSWTVLDTLTGSQTIDFDNDDSMGWDEIYSPCFVTDPYGYVSSSSLEIIYSTAEEPEEEEDISYKWSPSLAYYLITL